MPPWPCWLPPGWSAAPPAADSRAGRAARMQATLSGKLVVAPSATSLRGNQFPNVLPQCKASSLMLCPYMGLPERAMHPDHPQCTAR